MKIYTRRGDDGSTGLFHGGRVSKDGSGPEAYGAVDEAVSALGVARAVAPEGLATRLLALQRDLFVVAAELATGPSSRGMLEGGVSLVTSEMVVRLEGWIDDLGGTNPREFVVPGGSTPAAALDVARSTTRRAERRAVRHLSAEKVEGSWVVPYLNRLGDYLFVLAHSVEDEWVPSKEPS